MDLTGCSLLPSVLRGEIARLAAIQAIVLSVLAQTDIMRALAQRTIPLALAARLFFVALETDEWLGHFSQCTA